MVRLIALFVFCAVSIPAQQVDKVPSTPGLYYNSPTGWLEIRKNLIWPYVADVWKWWSGFGSRSWVMEFPGARAEVRVPAGRPVFHVRGYHPGVRWRLLRVDREEDRRTLRIPLKQPATRRPPFRERDLREVEFSVAQGNVLEIRPRSAIEAGEYVLAASASPGQQWLLVGYEFGVAR